MHSAGFVKDNFHERSSWVYTPPCKAKIRNLGCVNKTG